MKIKLYLVLCVLSFVSLNCFSQWTTSGNAIYTNSGSVGIGTSTPSYKLHIATTNSLEGMQLIHNSFNWLSLFSPSMTGGAFNGITAWGDAGIIFGSNAGLNTVNYGFVIAPHRGGVSGLRVNQNGNVSIGTTSADLPLTVNGKIKCEEIQVVVDVADYVFEENYPLITLEEVEHFIKENKHLPGVPDKKDVDANGFQVGLMTNKLLEKMEELTLYMIELKKENEILKYRLDKVENPK